MPLVVLALELFEIVLRLPPLPGPFRHRLLHPALAKHVVLPPPPPPRIERLLQVDGPLPGEEEFRAAQLQSGGGVNGACEEVIGIGERIPTGDEEADPQGAEQGGAVFTYRRAGSLEGGGIRLGALRGAEVVLGDRRVVVELVEAAVPIPITLKIDAVKVIRRETDEDEDI